MRKRVFVSAVVSVCVLASQAGAETVNRVRKDAGPGMPIMPASAEVFYDWSGPYMGLSLGGGWGTATQHYDRAGDHGTASLSPSGGVASLTAGYNWQFSPSIIIGTEADLGIMNVSQGTTTVFDGHNWSTDADAWGTLRGRAGYLASDRLLAYGTAGLAVANFDDTSIGNTAGETAIDRGLRFGLALGVGAEYAMSDRWTVKAELLHLDFAKASGSSANNEDFTFDDNINILRVGANMKF
jgi:outer membrane immunogenic protein